MFPKCKVGVISTFGSSQSSTVGKTKRKPLIVLADSSSCWRYKEKCFVDNIFEEQYLQYCKLAARNVVGAFWVKYFERSSRNRPIAGYTECQLIDYISISKTATLQTVAAGV